MAGFDDFPDDPLTPVELRKIRMQIRDWERASWAKKQVMIIGATVGGFALGLLAFKDGIVGFFKGLVK